LSYQIFFIFVIAKDAGKILASLFFLIEYIDFKQKSKVILWTFSHKLPFLK